MLKQFKTKTGSIEEQKNKTTILFRSDPIALHNHDAEQYKMEIKRMVHLEAWNNMCFMRARKNSTKPCCSKRSPRDTCGSRIRATRES